MVAIEVRRPPSRFSVPSFWCAGPRRISSSVPRMPAANAGAARQVGVEGRHAPVVAAAGRLGGAARAASRS